MIDLSQASWRKSSRSGSSGSCVEIATLAAVIAVRDSKDPHGPVLTVTPTQWRRFLCSLRS